MGTSSITCIKIGGEYKIAQLGVMDGYPSGHGIQMLAFLRDTIMKDQKNIIRFQYSLNTRCSLTKDYKQDNIPDYGEDLLIRIFTALPLENLSFENSFSFAYDSLFCEWGYVIDFDTWRFEVYAGWNKYPLDETERFYLQEDELRELFPLRGTDESITEFYYPIRLVMKYDLDKLPSAAEFLYDLSPKTESDKLNDQELLILELIQAEKFARVSKPKSISKHSKGERIKYSNTRSL